MGKPSFLCTTNAIKGGNAVETLEVMSDRWKLPFTHTVRSRDIITETDHARQKAGGCSGANLNIMKFCHIQ